MNLRKEELPATLQAFELSDNNEIFLAEQVVNNQSEIETFTTRFAGKLIKATPVVNPEYAGNKADTVYPKRKSNGGIVMAVIVVVLIILVIYGFSTGWIQQKLQWNK